MVLQMLSRLSRVRITLGYAAVLVAVSAALVELGPRVRAQVIAQASTNLHNLARGHLATLLDSAFVTDSVRCTSGCPAWCACSRWPS